MAEKRMFAKTIVDSDAFLDMPHSTQLLYFHLAMRADDDGFINKPKTVMRAVSCKDDDMKLLIAKKFVLPFESGVVVIKHWKIHNYIQADRYKETKYKEEKAQLELDENKAYRMAMDTECVQPVSKMETQIRVRLDKTIYSPTDVVVDIEDCFKKTYGIYPRKVGKAKGWASYKAYLTKGKEVSGQRYRFNHQQLYIAISKYALDCEGKEQQYIKHFDVFMNGAVVDYVENTAEAYADFMQEEYGGQDVKFRYE